MVVAGNLELLASLDSSDFERGNRRVKQGLDDTTDKAKQSNIGFSRLGDTVGGIAKTFASLGTAGVGALTALGLKSPVVADELANIKVSAFELGNALGPQLEPALENINDLIQSITTLSKGSFGEIFGLVATGITSFPLAILKDINNALDKYNEFVGKNKEEKTGTVNVSGTNVERSELPTFTENLGLGFETIKEEGFFSSFGKIYSGLVNAQQAYNIPLLHKPVFDLTKIFNSESDRKNSTLNTPD